MDQVAFLIFIKMKAYHILTFFLLFYSVISEAQSFGTPSSVWTYDLETFGKQVVEYDKDTILLDKDFSRYSITRFYHRSVTMDTFIQARRPIYVNNSDGLVTFTDDLVHFDTMINYAASLGDSWVLVGEQDTFDVVVIDTFRSEINGQSLFAYTNEFIWRRNNNYLLDTIYDHIGSINNFIIPYKGWGFIGGFTGGHLRCYNDDEIGFANFESIVDAASHFQLDCANAVNTNSPQIKPALSIHPNPFVNEICIESEKTIDDEVFVYNSSGSLISKAPFEASRTCLDLSHLDSGLYFVSIGSSVEKVIKL